jgi:membrane protein
VSFLAGLVLAIVIRRKPKRKGKNLLLQDMES